MTAPNATAAHPRRFRLQAREALQDEHLRQALDRARDGFVAKRAHAVAGRPDFEALTAAAAQIKDGALERMEDHLQRFESHVTARGGCVHHAVDAQAARQAVLEICRSREARRVTKGKSMVGEEVGLNQALEGAGLEVTETDLGEYIIQLAGEAPSHIIAPAVHKTREQISALFAQHHGTPPRGEVAELVNEARSVLRERYLQADVGITGANFLVAETGTTVLVTNEGNGDLTACLPKVHVVIAGIDKVVPTFRETCTLLRVLARSATGQELTSYTSFFTGPAAEADGEGPTEYHVILVDNGRRAIRDSEFRPMLRCIRCGACMNHCPVYATAGGHAYGWVYPGPMGSVLTPLMLGLDQAPDLPRACTLNGRCGSVCPVQIPLPDLLRRLRERQYEGGVVSARYRWGTRLWGAVARRPWLYRPLSSLGARLLGWAGGTRGRVRRLPGAGGWVAARDLPTPTRGGTFIARWQRGERP